MEVQWFPGHMAKALRDVKERLKLVDMVIEVCDARIPMSSRNPVLDEILGDKPRLVLLNKSDLADGAFTDKWINSFSSANIYAIASEGIDRTSAKKTITACSSICADKLRKAKERGQLIRPVRAMVVGIPNSGKSSIINSISGRKTAVTSDRPGVTRVPQWIRAGNEMELMDMPGVLWPKIGTKEGQVLLAAIGSVKDSVIDVNEVAFASMKIVSRLYPDLLDKRYKIRVESEITADDFERAALLRGCVRSGGNPDLDRFSNIFLDELRAGKAGRMTFERP